MTKQQEAQLIHRLPAEVVARIAAGEMISRPAALVKELIENALDAGGTHLSIEIREALDRFLRVSDNGCGIRRAELALAFERHATSKIASEEDLLAVETLGFRGEALASIAEIARVSLVSRMAQDEHAWELRAEGGEIGEVIAAARAPGTTVTVEDLFFNTPVRKRFLKKGAGEMRLARATLSAYALIAPGIAWDLEIDGKQSLHLPSTTDLRARLAQLHGERLAEGLLEINWREEQVALHGYVGVPELARGGTQHQTVFVNGRWVSAPWIGKAVRHGYGDLIPNHQSPWLALFLVIPPDSVDVNLHPTKREVRFFDERAIFGIVQRAVHQAVARLLPRFFLGKEESPASAPAARPADHPGLGFRGAAPREMHAPARGPAFDGLEEAARLYGGRARVPEEEGEALTAFPKGEAPQEGLVSLWQLHNRYVLAQTRKGLLIIDQHAAHERILYEEIRTRLTSGASGAQQLLFPVVIELDDLQMGLYQEMREQLTAMGFDLEEFGDLSVLVRGVPPLWRARSEAELLRDLLDEAVSMGLREGETVEGLARSFACRAAIKAGEPLSMEEMNRLVDQLFGTSRPHGDPHGRPTFVFISLTDLDRRFGRGGGVA